MPNATEEKYRVSYSGLPILSDPLKREPASLLTVATNLQPSAPCKYMQKIENGEDTGEVSYHESLKK